MLISICASIASFSRRVDHEEMPRVISAASIVCLPSYHEGLPKILIEAAAMGRPVVAFDVQGCRDIVIDGYNGKLAKPFDSTSLAQALNFILKDKAIALKMSLNGTNLVKEKFSANIINTKTIKLWEES